MWTTVGTLAMFAHRRWLVNYFRFFGINFYFFINIGRNEQPYLVSKNSSDWLWWENIIKNLSGILWINIIFRIPYFKRKKGTLIGSLFVRLSVWLPNLSKTIFFSILGLWVYSAVNNQAYYSMHSKYMAMNFPFLYAKVSDLIILKLETLGSYVLQIKEKVYIYKFLTRDEVLRKKWV